MVEMREAKQAAEGKVELAPSHTHTHQLHTLMHTHTSWRAGHLNFLLLRGLQSRGRDPGSHMSSLLPLQSTALPQDIQYTRLCMWAHTHTHTQTQANWTKQFGSCLIIWLFLHCHSMLLQSLTSPLLLSINPHLCSRNMREGAAAMQH